MHTDEFEELRRAFLAAYEQPNHVGFRLEAYPVFADKPEAEWKQRECVRIAMIPIPFKRSRAEYCNIYASADKGSKPFLKLCKDLGNRAGSRLPDDVRREIQESVSPHAVPPVDGLSWWLTLLFLEVYPDISDSAIGEFEDGSRSMLLGSFFHRSAQVIVQYRLNQAEHLDGNDPPDHIEECLEHQPLKLYRFLRQRTQWTTFDTLLEQPGIWRETRNPDHDPKPAVVRALKRLRTCLNECDAPLHLDIRTTEQRTKLICTTDK